MKNLIRTILVIAFLALPVQAFADYHIDSKAKATCPDIAEMEKMQGEMKDMMDHGMMNGKESPAETPEDYEIHH